MKDRRTLKIQMKDLIKLTLNHNHPSENKKIINITEINKNTNHK